MENKLDFFKQWFNGLTNQPLTNELKTEILDNLELVFDEVFDNGRNSAKNEINFLIDVKKSTLKDGIK